MAVDRPATSQDLVPQEFRRGRPICSGEDAASQPYGMGGVHAESNHAQAYMVQRLLSSRTNDVVGGDNELFETTSGTLVDLFGDVDVEVGKHVRVLRLSTDIENGVARLTTSIGNSAETTFGASRATRTSTLTRAAGLAAATIQLKVEFRASGGGTCKVFGYNVYEVEMDALDIQ